MYKTEYGIVVPHVTMEEMDQINRELGTCVGTEQSAMGTATGRLLRASTSICLRKKELIGACLRAKL